MKSHQIQQKDKIARQLTNQPTNLPASQTDKQVDRHDETQKHYNCNRFYFSRPMYKQR